MTDTISDEALQVATTVLDTGDVVCGAEIIQSALIAARQEAACKERERIATIVSGWRNEVPMSGEECSDAIRALSLEEQP